MELPVVACCVDEPVVSNGHSKAADHADPRDPVDRAVSGVKRPKIRVIEVDIYSSIRTDDRFRPARIAYVIEERFRIAGVIIILIKRTGIGIGKIC